MLPISSIFNVRLYFSTIKVKDSISAQVVLDVIDNKQINQHSGLFVKLCYLSGPEQRWYVTVRIHHIITAYYEI